MSSNGGRSDRDTLVRLEALYEQTAQKAEANRKDVILLRSDMADLETDVQRLNTCLEQMGKAVKGLRTRQDAIERIQWRLLLGLAVIGGTIASRSDWSWIASLVYRF